jgi:GT2 family glycosyltransferase
VLSRSQERNGADRLITLLMISHSCGQSLTAALRALRHQTLTRDLYELVLVLDGCRGDDLPIDVRRQEIRILELQPSQGRSKARNAGLQVAMGDAIVSLDGDMIAHPRLLQYYYTLQKDRAGIYVGSRNYSMEIPSAADLETESTLTTFVTRRTIKVDYRVRFLFRTAFLARSAEPFWALSTCNCSYPASSALDCGGFDEAINGWGLEDQEFGYRLWKSGLTFAYSHHALGTHIEHERIPELENASWARNQQYCQQKHGVQFRDPHRSMGQPVLLPLLQCSNNSLNRPTIGRTECV